MMSTLGRKRIILTCNKYLHAAAVFLIAIGSGPSARANLIINGDFELPAIAPGSASSFAGGSTSITGWTVLGKNVDILKTDYQENSLGVTAFNSQSGTQSVDLTGNANTGPTDGLSQTIATTAGAKYALSFWVGSALSNNGSLLYQAPGATDDLSINSGPSIPFTSIPVNSGGVTWTNYSYQFFATGSATTIGFLNGTPLTTNFAGLDNVSVTAVPEPASAGLVALCAALAYHRRSAWRTSWRAKRASSKLHAAPTL